MFDLGVHRKVGEVHGAGCLDGQSHATQHLVVPHSDDDDYDDDDDDDYDGDDDGDDDDDDDDVSTQHLSIPHYPQELVLRCGLRRRIQSYIP